MHSFAPWPPETKYITLVSGAPDVPLPKAEYLDVHFRVAEILQVSDLAGKLDNTISPDIPDPRQLASDGSTDIDLILRHRMLTDV